jgi:archaellum component FlaC
MGMWMRRGATMINRISFIVFPSLVLFSFALYAEEAAEGSDSLDSLMKRASEAEKMEDCETAYNLYNSALGEVELMDAEKYRNKIKELRSVITTKLYKLEPCYKACNPSERQKALFERAKSLSEEGQRKRMIQILRRMLVGKNEKCAFWKKVRAFLNTVPGEENINENADPCEVSEELRQEMNAAREEVKRLQSEITKYTNLKKGEFSKKVDDLVDFFKKIEEARIKIFQFREEFMDCDEVYKGLADDSNQLKSMYEQTRDVIITGYKGLVSNLVASVSNLKKQLKMKNEELEKIKDEYTRLKTQFDELSQFNEQIFNDLFALANIESIKPTVEMEGKEYSAIFENVNEVIKDQKKVLELMKQKYPEYFENGVNIEALKRKQFVIDKMAQILGRFRDSPQGQTIGYNRTIDELNATSKMMESIIKNAKLKEETGIAKGESRWLVVALVLLVIIGMGAIISGIYLIRRKGSGDVQ